MWRSITGIPILNLSIGPKLKTLLKSEFNLKHYKYCSAGIMTVVLLSLLTGCGGGSSSSNDSTSDASPGLDIAPDAFLHGAWLQECPEGTAGTDENACESDPWTLILGEAVLEGPGTMVSHGAACGGDDTWGTFSFTDDQLELFNCNSDYQNNGTPGETGTGQVFTASFEPTTEVLTLDNGTESYQLKSLTLESNALVAQRLIVTDEIDCDGSRIDYHEISSADTLQWASTLSYQEGKLFMDEFFDNEVDTYVSGWGFYEADDRGAQSAEYPAEAGIALFDFRIVHAADLTPISAVGHELHCDGAIGDSNYKGWEIDFERDITYRRYWNNSSVDVTGEAFSSIDISDQTGVASEVLVTAYVTSTGAGMLKLVLTSPDGTSVILADGQNGDGSISSYYYTSFVDYGVADVTSTELTTFENLLTPEEPLSVLVGDSLNGQWKLTVFDVGSGATINYFGLSVR